MMTDKGTAVFRPNRTDKGEAGVREDNREHSSRLAAIYRLTWGQELL
jgi:hypothetical protein